MRYLTPLVLAFLIVFHAYAAEPAPDPLRILPTPTGCAVVFDKVSGEYRIDRLVDGGVTVALYNLKLPPQEREAPASCLTRFRISTALNGQGSMVELRPANYEFSSFIRTGSALTIAFEKVVDIGGPPTASEADRTYRIGIGDQLQITVYTHEDLSKKVVVGPDGSIDYPLLGNVKAAGRTVRELQDGLRTDLGKDYIVNPQVSVEIAGYKSKFVFMTGAVKTPGKVALEGGTTLKDALSAAGGLTPEAGYAITVARVTTGSDGLPRDPEKLRFSRSDIESGLANLTLQPSDVVTVSEKDYFYIQGEVRKPGKYGLEPGLTLLQAIAVAEGLTDWADMKEIGVTRKIEGKSERRLANLKNIERQKEPDIALAAGDVIIVKRRIL